MVTVKPLVLAMPATVSLVVVVALVLSLVSVVSAFSSPSLAQLRSEFRELDYDIRHTPLIDEILHTQEEALGVLDTVTDFINLIDRTVPQQPFEEAQRANSNLNVRVGVDIFLLGDFGQHAGPNAAQGRGNIQKGYKTIWKTWITSLQQVYAQDAPGIQVTFVPNLIQTSPLVDSAVRERLANLVLPLDTSDLMNSTSAASPTSTSTAAAYYLNAWEVELFLQELSRETRISSTIVMSNDPQRKPTDLAAEDDDIPAFDLGTNDNSVGQKFADSSFFLLNFVNLLNSPEYTFLSGFSTQHLQELSVIPSVLAECLAVLRGQPRPHRVLLEPDKNSNLNDSDEVLGEHVSIRNLNEGTLVDAMTASQRWADMKKPETRILEVNFIRNRTLLCLTACDDVQYSLEARALRFLRCTADGGSSGEPQQFTIKCPYKVALAKAIFNVVRGNKLWNEPCAKRTWVGSSGVIFQDLQAMGALRYYVV
jgi:hypothetical protein